MKSPRTLKNWVLFAALGLLSSCGIDSPFSGQLRTSLRDHNASALEEIRRKEAARTGPVRVGLLTDSHQNYGDLKKAVDRLNSLDLDFIVHLGDFTNISLNSEYDAFAMFVKALRHPTLVVIGNHDAIGAGIPMYKKVFGEFNEAFSYPGASVRPVQLELLGVQGPRRLRSRLAGRRADDGHRADLRVPARQLREHDELHPLRDRRK